MLIKDLHAVRSSPQNTDKQCEEFRCYNVLLFNALDMSIIKTMPMPPRPQMLKYKVYKSKWKHSQCASLLLRSHSFLAIWSCHASASTSAQTVQKALDDEPKQKKQECLQKKQPKFMAITNIFITFAPANASMKRARTKVGIAQLVRVSP